MKKFKRLDTEIKDLKGETTHLVSEDKQIYVVVATVLNEIGLPRTSIFKSDETGDIMDGFFHLFKSYKFIRPMTHKTVVNLLENGELDIGWIEVT